MARIRGVDEHIAVRFAPQRLINPLGMKKAPTEFEAVKAGAFCGIGNPNGFRRTLRDLGLNVELQPYPDHHHYTRDDLARLTAWQRDLGAEALLTTMKDLVKIPPEDPLAPHVWAVEIAPEFLAGEDHLLRKLDALVPSRIIRHAA